MKKTTSLLLALALSAALLTITPEAPQARIIHKERSLYSTILLDKQGSTICLQFSVRHDQRNQSCKDLDNPRKLVFGYARMMMKALLRN